MLYLDGDSLWLDDPLELWKHFEAMQRSDAVWGLVEEAAAGRNWYTEGEEGCDLHHASWSGRILKDRPVQETYTRHTQHKVW